jgi:hypothetical protein
MMKNFSCLILSILITLNLSVHSQTNQTASTSIKIKENTYSKLKVISSTALNDLSSIKVKTKRGNFNHLSFPDYSYSNDVGSPALPVLRKLIEVPLDAEIQINILNSEFGEYSLTDLGIQNKIIPAQPPLFKNQDPTKVDFKYNLAVYSENKYLEHQLVNLTFVGMMRGVNLYMLEIAPMFYNPAQNKIKLYSKLDVEVKFINADIAKTIKLKEDKYSIYFDPSFSAVFNYKTLENKANFTKYPVKYVIVADPMFQSQLQPLVQWKTKKGFTVVEAYTNNPDVGNTNTSIKAYLANLYNSGTISDPAPSFILICGDIAQVSSFAGTTGSHVSDLKYAEYTGDFLPEVFYGRFSATNTSEMQPQIDKTLEYEKYLMPNPSFLDTCVMIAGQDATNGPTFADGQINYGTETYFNNANGLFTYKYPYAISGSSVAQIKQNVSVGAGFVNYTAHGDWDGWSGPSFNISDVANLNNAHKYPLMIGNACLTNKFDEPVCFGEALLRAENKGALGYIGASNSSLWTEDYYWAVGFRSFSTTPPLHPTYDATKVGAYDRTWHTHSEDFPEWYTTQGQMVNAGNLAVTQSGSSETNYYWEIYHLMGDPSLMIYYTVPEAITATYSPLLPVGSTSLTINTNTPYCYAALSMSGTLYGAALANSAGIITINFNSITTPGTADIVITAQNRHPFSGTVLINNPTGPYVLFNKYHINDASGNNDTTANPGENITLDVTLKNYGSQIANGVIAKIKTNDAYFTITDSTQSWGSIASNTSSLQADAYALSVSNSAPDSHIANFVMTVTDGNSNTWNSQFSIAVCAPKLKIGDFSIADAAGINNHVLVPGETANITINTLNNGHGNAYNTTGILTTTSPLITINSGSHNLGTIAKLSSADALFNITVNPTISDTAVVELIYTVSSGTLSENMHYFIQIGQAVEDWESKTFVKFPWVRTGNTQWGIDSITKFEGLYSARSGNITDDQSSSLSIALEVKKSDTISFYRKVSCEKGSEWGGTYQWYDFLEFLIDGTSKGKWDGEENWAKFSYPIDIGNHILKWTYLKDNSQTEGSDCAWLDYIIFPPYNRQNIGIKENSLNFTNLNCYPNPSKGLTYITFDLSEQSIVNLSLINILGQSIKTFFNNTTRAAGTNTLAFDASLLPAGIYYIVLSTENDIKTYKLMITK